MRNTISVVIIGLVAISAVGCASTSQVSTANANELTAPTFTENLKCGKSFSSDGWASGYTFAYEVLDKTSKGKGYKVKTLANVNGRMIHLDCERDLPSRDAALAWLLDSGYGIGSDGSETGGASGDHLTVDRGPLYKVPAYLYN